jgi:hypothetical protein
MIDNLVHLTHALLGKYPCLSQASRAYVLVNSTNAALGRPTTQSSVDIFDGENAVDGDISTCAHTQAATATLGSTTWEVTLGTGLTVARVIVTTDVTSGGSFEVYVDDELVGNAEMGESSSQYEYTETLTLEYFESNTNRYSANDVTLVGECELSSSTDLCYYPYDAQSWLQPGINDNNVDSYESNGVHFVTLTSTTTSATGALALCQAAGYQIAVPRTSNEHTQAGLACPSGLLGVTDETEDGVWLDLNDGTTDVTADIIWGASTDNGVLAIIASDGTVSDVAEDGTSYYPCCQSHEPINVNPNSVCTYDPSLGQFAYTGLVMGATSSELSTVHSTYYDAVDGATISFTYDESTFNTKTYGCVARSTVEASEVPSYQSADSEFTFTGNFDGHRYSVWIEIGDSVSSGAWLELCEVEVYAEPSDFEAGTSDNPNVALSRIATANSLLINSGYASNLVDGDTTTCARTQIGATAGSFRIDLDPGHVPMQVVVHGRIYDEDGSEYDCSSQELGINGATVSIGTPTYTIESFDYALEYACGLQKHTRFSQLDSAAHYVEIKVEHTLNICEVQLYHEEDSSGEAEYDLTSMASFITAPGLQATAARLLNDGNTECDASSIVGPAVIGFFIHPHIVPTRLVLHFENYDSTSTVNSAANDIEATTGTGYSLGSFGAFTPNDPAFGNTFIGSGNATLNIISTVQASYSDYVAYKLSLVHSEAEDYCGVGGSKYIAGESYQVYTSSTACDCEALCEADSACIAWSYYRNAQHAKYRHCYLSQFYVTSDAITGENVVWCSCWST